MRLSFPKDQKHKVDEVIKKYEKIGWNVSSINLINNEYVVTFESKNVSRANLYLNIDFILSIFSIIGFAGLFSAGLILLFIKLYSSPPEWFMILFYVFVLVGIVGSIFGIFSLIAVRKKASYKWFYLLGVCTCLIGNIFFGPILIITANKIKNKQ